MGGIFESDSLIDTYIFETAQIINQLEEAILLAEQEGIFLEEAIHLIFRLMHTVKGSSAMMGYTEISSLSHAMEDLFFYLRENPAVTYDLSSLTDLLFAGIDFMKVELEKVKNKDLVDGKAEALIESIKAFLCLMRQQSGQVIDDHKHDNRLETPISTANVHGRNHFCTTLRFMTDAGMENLRLLAVTRNLHEIAEEVLCRPDESLTDEEANAWIREKGAQIEFFTSHDLLEVTAYLQETVFLESLVVDELDDAACSEHESEYEINDKSKDTSKNIVKSTSPIGSSQAPAWEREDGPTSSVSDRDFERTNKIVQSYNSNSSFCGQNYISVQVEKLDRLMDLVGEMVITKAMVIQNPEVNRLEIESFQKASRQLQKITSELQDMVMAIRMVPLSATFLKMQRIVRDMCRKLDKKVELVVIGDETEVDKNVIEKISDPLMHIIRNAIDHGIEEAEHRIKAGKSVTGTVILEAKNVGNEVLVTVRDDGRGINRTNVYQKARDMGLLELSMEEMSEREINQLILHPGFSTKAEITEFSGRGVGMDVVSKNIESIGGLVFVDSTEGKGTLVSLKIPLTLAIIEGMNILVGEAKYTVPIASIRESFRPDKERIFQDPDGNEMILVRGFVYPMIRLHTLYENETDIVQFTDGILLMVESESNVFCLFADCLVGEQQVVVKPLPAYLKKFKKIGGIGGCTLLGDGSISLVLDIGELGTLIRSKGEKQDG